MSLKAQIWAYEIAQVSGPSEKAVLAYLAYCANKDNDAWPAVSRIVEETQISERSVRYALKSLVDQGLIIKTKRLSDNGRTTTSNYRLKLHRTGVQPLQGVGATDAGGGCNNSTLVPDLQSDLKSDLKKQTPSAFAIPPPGIVFTDEQMKVALKKLKEPTLVTVMSAAQMGEFVKAHEVIASGKPDFDHALTKAKKKGHYTNLSLQILWKDIVVIFYANQFYVGPVSAKWSGQIGHLRKKLEGVDVGVVMFEVIKRWVEYGKFLKEQGVVYDFPDKPHLGFFLKHGELAVDFMKKPASNVTTIGGFKPYVIGGDCN